MCCLFLLCKQGMEGYLRCHVYVLCCEYKQFVDNRIIFFKKNAYNP